MDRVILSSDRRLLTTATSNLIQTWELGNKQPIPDLVQEACTRLGKNLDKSQWADVLSQERYDEILKVCVSSSSTTNT